MEDDLKWKTTSNVRRPQMEDGLKILKEVEHLRNHWLDLSQILNLSLGDQTESKNSLKWRRIQMEDDLQ